jgi:hypothetical protein
MTKGPFVVIGGPLVVIKGRPGMNDGPFGLEGGPVVFLRARRVDRRAPFACIKASPPRVQGTLRRAGEAFVGRSDAFAASLCPSHYLNRPGSDFVPRAMSNLWHEVRGASS